MTDHATYIKGINTFQNEKDAQLRVADGWLTLAGLYWLREGVNRIGGGDSNHIPLPANVSPAELGILEFSPPSDVVLHLNEGKTVAVNGKERSGSIALESDINRNPTIVHLGPVSFFIIQRGEKTGVRVKHANHPNRVNFTGREWWPIDESFRLEARIIPYDQPKKIIIPDILGNENEAEILAALRFEFQGKQFSLDAQVIPSGQFYLIFHDLSCGKGSYPPGRFLLSEQPDGDTVIVDFNKANNPPCAFTDFATCPLPPRENFLSIALPAGERYKPRELTS